VRRGCERGAEQEPDQKTKRYVQPTLTSTLSSVQLFR
jgi:hypothetical protein